MLRHPHIVAADARGQSLGPQSTQRRLHRIFVVRHHRLTVGFLIARVHQRVERERVILGCGDLFFGMLALELVVIAGLSPELGEALVKLGYSEPCELRIVPTERTITALRRSKQWRRHAGLLTAEVPVDIWRELCWRYLVF